MRSVAADRERGDKSRDVGARGATRPTPMRRLFCRCFTWLLVAMTSSVWSAAPTLEHFHPPGIGVGTTNTVRITGKFEPWPPKVRVDQPGLEFLATTNKGEFQITVAADAKPGVRLVRLFNEEGTSEPRPFVIGEVTDVLEAEPNDHFAKPQIVDALPRTINGRLEKRGDVDSFAVELKAGQTLEARVDSVVLMSRLDAVLRLVATNGQQLAWNHDFATIDPRLTWTAPIDQRVVVQVFGFPYPATADIAFTGGDGAVYRLHLNVMAAAASETNAPFDPTKLVSLPFATSDVLLQTNVTRRFKVLVAEPGWLVASVAAESIGSPLDAWLRLDGADGKQINRIDDANESRDPVLEWHASANTEYSVVVGSVAQRPGDDARFQFAIQRVEPGFEASAASSSVTLKPGTTNEVKVTVARLRGFTNELQLIATNLPPGILCAPATVGDKGGEVKLALVAAPDAATFQGPFGVVIRDVPTGTERLVPFKLTGTSTDNGVPGGYRTLLADRLEALWLTVLAVEPPKTEPKAEQAGK